MGMVSLLISIELIFIAWVVLFYGLDPFIFKGKGSGVYQFIKHVKQNQFSTVVTQIEIWKS
jgi:hypothetical protein